jgi:hypothetical protein
LAYNFNDPTTGPFGADPQSAPARTAAPEAPAASPTSPAPAAAEAPISPGFARFASCRWQQPKEEGTAAFCTHREVKPYAGTASFDADAWCPECQYYKLRRAPKKRTPADEYSY